MCSHQLQSLNWCAFACACVPCVDLWPGVRPEPVQHRGCGWLQHGRDGEQVPEHLQLQVRICVCVPWREGVSPMLKPRCACVRVRAQLRVQHRLPPDASW